MSDFTHVYLITGFLGSGKTTFLNRIIKQFLLRLLGALLRAALASL